MDDAFRIIDCGKRNPLTFAIRSLNKPAFVIEKVLVERWITICILVFKELEELFEWVQSRRRNELSIAVWKFVLHLLDCADSDIFPADRCVFKMFNHVTDSFREPIVR